MIRVRILSLVMAFALFVGTAVVPVRTSAQGLVEYALILVLVAVVVERVPESPASLCPPSW